MVERKHLVELMVLGKYNTYSVNLNILICTEGWSARLLLADQLLLLHLQGLHQCTASPARPEHQAKTNTFFRYRL